MGGTTFSAIRTAQLEVLRELVMTDIPGDRLRLRTGDNHPDVVAWADAAAGPFRVFDIEHALDLGEEKYLDTATDEDLHTERVLVAYPAVRTWEGRELEDLIESDVNDIARALGERGGPDYSGVGFGVHRCALVGQTVLERPAARVLQLTFELHYDRSMT